VRVRGLVKRYPDKVAVAGVDLDIRHGEVFALLGPNGAGKTTTTEILEGYRRADEGDVRVLGIDPARADRHWRARVGIVAQSSRDEAELSVAELVEHFAGYYPNPRDPDEVIASVGLEEKRKTRTRKLSGGQRRRLDVAMGLVHAPKLLFLDEPSTGLDPQNRANLWDHILRMRAQYEMTIVLTTHYLDEVDQLAERVIVIDHGRIIADDTPARLKAEHAGDRITLTFDQDVDRAMAHAQGFLPGSDIHRVGTTIAIQADGGARLVPKLLRSLDEAGLTVAAVEVARPTLDDVFLNLTGRSLREDVAAPVLQESAA
jgi:ABC-2 type transport system ATP-binding protein